MGKIIIKSFCLGPVQTNCYYLHDEDSQEIILFDPADQGTELFKALREEGLTLKAIFLTHAHFDHVWGLADLKDLTGARVYVSEDEMRLCTDPIVNLSQGYGRPVQVMPDEWLRDGDIVKEAGITLQMISTPGHTEGSCCYYIDHSYPNPEMLDEPDPEDEIEQDRSGLLTQHILISGDTLFEGSVGRSDFPTGSQGRLVRSIREKLLILPDDTLVLPGHGGTTTIAYEKRYNPVI